MHPCRPFILTLVLASLAATQNPPPKSTHLSVIVLDENNVAVFGARITLQPPHPAAPLKCETTVSGRCDFPQLPAGPIHLAIENEGYYSSIAEGKFRPFPIQ
jgi:hypothetical protein